MKVRVVSLDFYMANPIPNLDILYSEFRGSSVNNVPVIRIYGSTESGEKICLHVHRVFPYIYIPHDGETRVDGFLYQVASALDKAINLSLGQASSSVQHVYKVCLVSGNPLYGYHARPHQFLRLYFYNPLIVKKACTLLQNGNILGKIYQAHEAHIPYILQFMMDYNLHGMSHIHLADLKYRYDQYSHDKYPENSVLPPSIRKMSTCKLEADTTGDCVLNREEITLGMLTANPGIKALWEDEAQRRRNNKEPSQIEHCLTQNRLDVPQTATHVAYKKLLDEKLTMKSKSSHVSPQLELSVYPAETPPSSDVLDASIVENHIFSSQSTDDSSILDQTITENLQSDTANLIDFTLDANAQELLDVLQRMREDNIDKDSILSQVQKEQGSDDEDPDLSLPLNATQTPSKLDEEANKKNVEDFLKNSYFESLAKIPQLDGTWEDDSSLEKDSKQRKEEKKRNIKKKTSEFYQPTIPKPKKLNGSGVGKKGRGRKRTFRIKTSAVFPKSRSKFSRAGHCMYCTNCKSDTTTSKKNVSPCLRHYFRNIKNTPNTQEKNCNLEDIESSINKVIENICKELDQNKTPTLATKDRVQFQTGTSNKEILQNQQPIQPWKNCRRKKTKMTMCTEESKENMNVVLLEGDMEVNKFDAENIKISHDLENHQKSNDLVEERMDFKLQNYTLDDAKVLNQIVNAGDAQKIVSKPVSEGNITPKNKRKSYPIKRIIPTAKVPKKSDTIKLTKNLIKCNLNEKAKDSLSRCSSCKESAENQVKEATMKSKTIKMITKKTMSPKKATIFAGDLQNSGNSGVQTLQTPETLIDITLPNLKQQVNEESENIVVHTILATEDLKEVLPIGMEEDAPNSDQAASLPEPIEQIQKNDLSTASDQVITERERIEESSGTEPKEKSQNQEERNKIGEISTIPSNLLFVGQKVNGELHEEEVQIKNLPEQEQLVREEVIKMPIITSNVEEFTNIIDPVKAETQNKIFEKCEQFLDMPPLSNSSSNKYDKKGSFEMHDDNNNTQINNFQSYFRDEKLEVRVEDQHDKDKEIKSLTNEVQGVDIVNKLIGSRPTNVTSSEVTNKNPKCSKKLSKSSPSKDVGKNSDINNKLKLGKGKRSKCRQKNKHAQTDSTPTVVHRRGRGRPLEVAANLIVTPSINKYDYKAQIRYFNRKYIPKHNLLAKYNLTPDFRPKFRIVQGYTPYPFEPRMMYPNTTWTRCIESGGLASNSCAEIGVQTDAPNSAITISDRLLEGEEKFENSQIEKGQVVKAIKSSIPKNLKLKIPGEIELMGTDKTETQNSGWSSQELRNVDDLCNLYDGLKELGVFSPENSSRGISKVFQSTTNTEKISQEHVLEGNRLYSGDKTSLETPNSDTSSRCSLSKVFQSIAGIQTPDQVEEHVLEGKKLYSGDKTSLETPDSDISSSYSLSKVLQLITDIQTPDQVDGANIPKFLRNYREDMKNREHNLMEKMRQSWNDHAASTASIIEGCCISGCRILENLKESTGQGDAKTLVGRRSEEIGTKLRSTGNCEVDPNASTNKYSKDEGKTSTLQGDENEIKDVPGLQNKGDGAKTGENKNIETTHFPLPTNNLGDHSLKPPSADSNELNDRSCTIFSQTNQRLSNASHTSTSTPSTIPKILYSSNSKSKDSLPGNSRKTGKPKKIPSLFNNSKILFENRDRPKEDLPLNHDLRLSDINSNDPPLAIQSNPLEDLKSLLKKNGSYVTTNLTNHNFPNMSHRDKPAPSVASTSLLCTNAECNRGISRKNSKESAEKLDFLENPKSSIQNQYQLKEDSKPSKITPNITKRPKHFKKEEYQGERVLKIPVSIDRSAISCNLGTSSEENVILSLSSVVNPSLLSKQDLHDAINSNRGKNLEADKKIRFKPVETDRASSANTSTSRSRKRRNKNEEKVGSVSIPAPCCSSSLVGTPKTSKKTKRSKKKDVSNQESASQAIAPKKSFAKPTDELNFGILKSSIPKHLKNDYQNPEDLLTMLLQNSEPINHKKDIDERAIIYDLLKKKLELSRTNQCPALKCELQRECSVYLRRYNFTSIRSAQFSRDSFKAKGSCKQDTSYQLTPLANEDFDANNYVADLNNNSKSALKIGSAVGKAPKRKIKKKKVSKEDEMDSFPVNQYRYLDGPNDSSSDGEEAIKPTPKKVCRQSRKAFPSSAKYSPLKVNFGSPSKKNLQKEATPFDEGDAKDTLKNQPQARYKRKLSFSKNISLDRTEIEEKLVCSYKSEQKPLPKNIAKVVTENNVKIEDENRPDTQHEFGATLITPYQKERFKIIPETVETALSTLYPKDTLDYQNITESTTQRSVPKRLFEISESQSDFRSSLITPYQKQSAKFTEIVENVQTKLVDRKRDLHTELGPSLLTPYQKQPSNFSNSPNLDFENRSENLTGEFQNVLGTALITPYQKERAKSPNSDDSQLSNSSASASDDIFSPNIPNSFSSEVFTSTEGADRLVSRNKDPAELYDARNMFVPQAGTSKFKDVQMFTQISESSDEVLTLKPFSWDSSKSENTIKTISTNSFISLGNEFKFSVDSGEENEKCGKVEELIDRDKAKIESSESDVTPYQKEQDLHQSDLKLTACLDIFELINQNVPGKNGYKLIVPKFQPPSRGLIEATLQDYNIPTEYHQEPFYSDIKDVTGPMEVGVRVLKIQSNTMVDLPEFESNFKGINHYRRSYLEYLYPNEKITNKDINNYKMSFCKRSDCIITPVKLPPSREEVELWLKRKLEKKEKAPKMIEKKKIFIPRSPGGDNDNSDDSLTISPCTPLDVTLKNIHETTDDTREDETSKSSLETKPDNASPVIKKSDALKRHRKRISQNSSSKSNHSSEGSLNLQELDITKEKRRDSCQITGVTLDRTNNFAISCDNLQNAKAVSEYLHLTVFCVELIIETRCDYKPNPAHDTVKGIVYQIFNDVPEEGPGKRSVKGCFLLNNAQISPTKVKFSILDGIVMNGDEMVQIFESETELITKFVEFFVDSDPDILVGYEIEMLSWGYLIERGYVLNLNLISLLSRVPQSTKNKNEDDLSDLTIPGRIILDFWRLLRHEIALQSYTFENIVYHILHQRVPLYSFRNITYWWNHASGLYRDKVLRYYFYRVEAILRIMDHLDLIGRTSELAKLFGIQFYEVLSRGSQFRVESMMLRLAKPLNYIPVSPSVQQRAKMRAPESLPLIMEPESKFYTDPVIVLDFQSLYPSMIIAYNYCFSTCLGRIEHLGQDIPFEFGATQLKVPRKYIKRLSRRDLINISPCGVGFVKKNVREGILPRMLQEILDTRLMVKKSLKKNAGNRTLGKVLDARQLGLKLIANVTYGYTAANFSGRMPCIEVADSVVSKGRETLQRAISLVGNTPRWGAKVVYGDTDSLFVLVAGKSRREAFKIGAEIAEAVTNDNPSPVKLKLEKVFHPCILQTKKRYVGYMYESAEQEEPEYLAKGIETVRRDGCPAVSKTLEKCLKILFDTRDVSLVRQYVVRQFSKILSGRISIQDLTFAKEYRGASNYRPGACVPALELARKWLSVDKRNEPRRGERVPYVIINGPPGLPLIRLVRCPRELIADPSLRPNALYYITKVIIPPINRCFLLIGADLNNWFNGMPRKQHQYLHNSSPVKGKKSTISQYFSTKNCAVCGLQSKDGLCEVCLSKPQNTSVVLHDKARVFERNYYETRMICQSCCGTADKVACISLDCPVYYKRIQTEKDVQQTSFIREVISFLPNFEF